MSRCINHVHSTLGHSAAAVSALRHCLAGTSLGAYDPNIRHDGQYKACHATISGARPAITVTAVVLSCPPPRVASDPTEANSRITARAALWSGKLVRGGRLKLASSDTGEEVVGANSPLPVVSDSFTTAGGRSKNKNKCEKPTLRCQRTQESTTDVPSAVSGT